MESPDEFMQKKSKVKDLRTEIKELKGTLFQNTAVMRADKLREYLDKLRYAENLINAKDALGGEKKELKSEHKKQHKKRETESLSESSSDDEKPVKPKKEKKEIEMIKKDIKKEAHASPAKVDKLHKDEKKHLKELEKHLQGIPKPMHSSYKKHLKASDGDHEKAKKLLKKDMKF